jgi:integrase
MNFFEFSHQWERGILPLKKPATQVTFRSHLEMLRKEFGQVDIGGISYHDTQRFFTAQSASKSPKTLRNLWGTMQVVLNQAKREGLVVSIPKPVLPKASRIQQQWFTVDQMRGIVKSSTGQYAVLLYVLAETGLRIGEALGLQTGDIDFGAKTLTVGRSVYAGKTQDPKTLSGFRTICLSERCNSLLQGVCLGNPLAFVFRTIRGTSLCANNLLVKHLHPVLLSLGIPQAGFHALRRGSITALAHIGCPEIVIATRVGHRMPGLTLGLYAQPVQLADREWVEKLAVLLQ